MASVPALECIPLWETVPRAGGRSVFPLHHRMGPDQHFEINTVPQHADYGNKGPYSQSYGFSISHVQMWELDHKEGWGLKNWCFLTAVLEKTLESPLDSRENKPVNPKGNQLWLFIGKTDAEAEAPILWPTNAKSQFIGKDYDAGKDWRQEKGVTEDEMVGWHHWVQQTWIWANSRRQSRTGKPVVLQSMGLQRLTQLSLWTLTMLLCSLLKI